MGETMWEKPEIPGLDAVLDYMKEWKTSHGRPAEGYTEDQLADLVEGIQKTMLEHVSFVDEQGRAIIAYSGSFEDTYAWKIVKEITKDKNGKYCYISDIPAGEIINHKDFKKYLYDILYDKSMYGRLQNGTEVNGIKTKYGVTDNLTFDDFVSKNLMELNARGDMIALTQTAAPDGVWERTDLEVALGNENVKSINGI